MLIQPVEEQNSFQKIIQDFLNKANKLKNLLKAKSIFKNRSEEKNQPLRDTKKVEAIPSELNIIPSKNDHNFRGDYNSKTNFTIELKNKSPEFFLTENKEEVFKLEKKDDGYIQEAENKFKHKQIKPHKKSIIFSDQEAQMIDREIEEIKRKEKYKLEEQKNKNQVLLSSFLMIIAQCFKLHVRKIYFSKI